jgi:hypothetical protein
MAYKQSSDLILWLLLGVVALIGYGSLYPFDFNFDSSHPTLRSAFAQLTWARAGQADRVRNILLYLPLGFCLILWLRARLGAVWATVLATVLGSLLSLSIELAQFYLSIRVPSLMDIVLNASGTLLGAIGGVVWRGLNALVYLPPNIRNRPSDRSALLVVSSWVLWRLAQFDPGISLTRLKLALQPLLEWNSSLLLIATFLLFWLVVAQAVLSFTNRARSNEVLLTVIAVVMIGRLLFVTPAFILSELIALMLLLPTLVMLHKFRGAPQSWLLLSLFAGLFIYERLVPVKFSAVAHRFDFWPFMQWFAQGMPIDPDTLLRKLFMFAALTWLLKDAGLPVRSAVMIVVTTVLGIEIFHLWQVGHHSSLTDPALALGMGWLVLLTSDERKSKKSSRFARFKRY